MTKKGFTLVELLVVLVIISMMAAFVGPRIAGSMSNLNLKTASKKLASALRYARNQAASQCATYVALLDFEERTVTVRAEKRGEPAEEGPEESEPDADHPEQRPKRFQLPEGVRFDRAVSGDEEWDSGIFQLVFYPDGGSSGGTVFLANVRDHQYHIVVDFIIGTVRLGEVNAER